jgi:hypothetical protein
MIRTTRYKLEYFINNNKLLQIRKENVQISIDLVYVEKKKKKGSIPYGIFLKQDHHFLRWIVPE